MTEAVIVATARSPIGRAFKGSLTTVRPDDLTCQMVTAALAKVPQLDPADAGDLILGCGLASATAASPVANRASTWRGWSRSCSGSITCPARR